VQPFDFAWARALVAECRAAGVAVFVKQMGSDPRDGLVKIQLKDTDHGEDMSEWAEDLRIREWPDPARRRARRASGAGKLHSG
jgi:hypothetical protein